MPVTWFDFFFYNIIIRGDLLEPHAISRIQVCYLKKKKKKKKKKKDARSAILSIFTVSLGQGR